MGYSMETITFSQQRWNLVVQVRAKLHNFCISERLATGLDLEDDIPLSGIRPGDI